MQNNTVTLELDGFEQLTTTLMTENLHRHRTVVI